MLRSQVFISTLLVLSIHFTSISLSVEDSKKTQDKYECDVGEHDECNETTSEINPDANIDDFALHFSKHRNIRSDNVTSNNVTSNNITGFNGTEVKKPDARLTPSQSNFSNVLSQIHTFFADKAREDAYQLTEAKDHPYSVSFLFYNRRGDTLGLCSGTLVTHSWVVTAAHCIVDQPVHSVKVYGGVTFNILRPPKYLSRRSQVRTSFEFVSHPRYDPHSDDIDYDIALIRIDPPFYSSDYLRPIPLTWTPWNYNGYRKCVLTAFGAVRDEMRSPDDYIRKTQYLLVKKPCDCVSYLEKNMGAQAVSRYICMKPQQDFGICSGDSGGGLICDGELKAVVSFSLPIGDLSQCHLKGPSGAAQCGDVDVFSIFQDIYPSLSWITKNAFHVNMTGNETDTNGADKKLLGSTTFMLCIVIWIGFTIMRYC